MTTNDEGTPRRPSTLGRALRVAFWVLVVAAASWIWPRLLQSYEVEVVASIEVHDDATDLFDDGALDLVVREAGDEVLRLTDPGASEPQLRSERGSVARDEFVEGLEVVLVPSRADATGLEYPLGRQDLVVSDVERGGPDRRVTASIDAARAEELAESFLRPIRLRVVRESSPATGVTGIEVVNYMRDEIRLTDRGDGYYDVAFTLKTYAALIEPDTEFSVHLVPREGSTTDTPSLVLTRANLLEPAEDDRVVALSESPCVLVLDLPEGADTTFSRRTLSNGKAITFVGEGLGNVRRVEWTNERGERVEVPIDAGARSETAMQVELPRGLDLGTWTLDVRARGTCDPRIGARARSITVRPSIGFDIPYGANETIAPDALLRFDWYAYGTPGRMDVRVESEGARVTDSAPLERETVRISAPDGKWTAGPVRIVLDARDASGTSYGIRREVDLRVAEQVVPSFSVLLSDDRGERFVIGVLGRRIRRVELEGGEDLPRTAWEERGNRVEFSELKSGARYVIHAEMGSSRRYRGTFTAVAGQDQAQAVVLNQIGG